MTKLETAAARLSAALDSVESKAVALAGAKKEAGEAKARAQELSQERERLLARIAELEEESRSLAGVTEDVEGRLDGAIAEIRAALGR